LGVTRCLVDPARFHERRLCSVEFPRRFVIALAMHFVVHFVVLAFHRHFLIGCRISSAHFRAWVPAKSEVAHCGVLPPVVAVPPVETSYSVD